MLALTTKRRRTLSALAHSLNPIVTIGKVGLSAGVIKELDHGLLSHELIKVKVMVDDRTARRALFDAICQQLDAALVKNIGKTLIVYRPKPEETEKTAMPAKRKNKREPHRTKRSYQG